ncbi:MAG: hypothetical protein ABIW79_08320, partial [Gemmatimonas sp.]
TDPLIMPGKEEVRSYPGARYRLQVAARELLDSEVHTRLRELAERDQTRSLIHVLDYLERQRNATARSAPFPADSPVAAVLEFAESTVADTMQRLPGRVHDLVPQDHLASLNDGLLALLREMHDPSRPSLTVTATTTYSQVLMAGWCFQLHYGDGQEEQGLPGRYDDHQQRLPTNKAAEHYRRTNEILADALNRILAQHALLDESPTAAQRADLSSEDVSVTPESDTSLEPEVRSI